MKGNAVKQKVDIPDGEYDALWSGYKLKILSSDGDEMVVSETYIGVKGINCSAKVKVKHGKVEFISQK